MAKKKPANNGDVLDLIVSYGNLNAGDKTARIGVTVSRDKLAISKAEKQFCEKRLACCLVMAPDGAHPDQGSLNGMMDDIELEATFDVKSIRFSADEISFGLTGALGSLDVSTLAKFAKKQGRLIVNDVSEIPEVDRKSAAAGEKDDDDGD
jgi:hypothetical protein